MGGTLTQDDLTRLMDEHDRKIDQMRRTTPFTVKDSGTRQEFASGMMRDTGEGKTRFWRVAAGPMLRRWAEHLGKGAKKYPDVAPGVSNWTLAEGDVEAQRFKESAFDHFMQWFYGETDEDHAAAVFFNINGHEYVRARQKKESQ